jgi:hypothetical protein
MNELNPLNSCIGENRFKKSLEKFSASLCDKRVIQKLNPLNSSTGLKNLLERFSAMLSHNGEIDE